MSSLCFTYKLEYLQIKQSSGGTGFSGFFAHFVYICIFWNLYIFHLLAYCMFILNVFGYWHVARILILISKQFLMSLSFKCYGLVFDTFAAELAWVCLPCVCVRALLAGHSERLQFVRHTDMILSLKPSDTPSAEVERLMNDVHWTLRDSNFIWLFSILPSSGH